jgi:hypothetical protein
MLHPLVSQLHFTRSEFVRCFEGVPPTDTSRRAEPLNSLSWAVGHLALQEHFYWVLLAQGKNIAPGLRERVGFRQPPSSPPWDEMWALWHTITRTADEYLLSLTSDDLDKRFVYEGKPLDEAIGTLLLRNIYHYWFHLGKAHAIRQVMGHTDLPVYVGNVSTASYALEAGEK